MSLAVIESIPVHEDIKLGLPTRDRLIDNYCESVRNMGRAGVPVLCYNFMPVFDWTRTELARRLDDGSTVLAFDDAALAKIDLSRGTADLPGWATAYYGGAAGETSGRLSLGEREQAVGELCLLPRARRMGGWLVGSADGAASRRSTVVDLWTSTHHHRRAGARARNPHRRRPRQRNHLLRRFARRRSEERSSGHNSQRRREGTHPLRALPQHQAHRHPLVPGDRASLGHWRHRHALGARIPASRLDSMVRYDPITGA